MVVVLVAGGLAALTLTGWLGYLLSRRLVPDGPAGRADYWLSVREAEILTRSTAPFI